MPEKPIEHTDYYPLLKAIYRKPNITTLELREITGFHRGYIRCLIYRMRKKGLLPPDVMISYWSKGKVRRALKKNGFAELIPKLEAYVREEKELARNQ